MEDVPGLQGNGLKLAGDADRSRLKGRLNLFNWDGRGRPDGLFPKPAGA
jgi:nitrate reductase beta subunit